MRLFAFPSIALAFICLGTCWGCGSGQPILPDLIPVKGRVSYKGQPLTSGIIRFEPDGFGRMATGKMQSDGTYVLSTMKQADGVVAGIHKVFVTDPDKSLAKDRTFKKFTQANSSGLTAEVSPEKTEFTFDLK
jgi:hypothetical protein